MIKFMRDFVWYMKFKKSAGGSLRIDKAIKFCLQVRKERKHMI